MVSFVWVKISNENKLRKGISIIPQQLPSLKASREERERLKLKALMARRALLSSNSLALKSQKEAAAQEPA